MSDCNNCGTPCPQCESHWQGIVEAKEAELAECKKVIEERGRAFQDAQQKTLVELAKVTTRVKDLEDVIRRLVTISVPHSDCSEKIEAEVNIIVKEWEKRTTGTEKKS